MYMLHQDATCNNQIECTESPQNMPLLGSNSQITQIWESYVFRSDLAYIFYIHSKLGAETLILLKDI